MSVTAIPPQRRCLFQQQLYWWGSSSIHTNQFPPPVATPFTSAPETRGKPSLPERTERCTDWNRISRRLHTPVLITWIPSEGRSRGKSNGCWALGKQTCHSAGQLPSSALQIPAFHHGEFWKLADAFKDTWLSRMSRASDLNAQRSVCSRAAHPSPPCTIIHPVKLRTCLLQLVCMLHVEKPSELGSYLKWNINALSAQLVKIKCNMLYGSAPTDVRIFSSIYITDFLPLHLTKLKSSCSNFSVLGFVSWESNGTITSSKSIFTYSLAIKIFFCH